MNEKSKKQNPKVEDLSQYGKTLTGLPQEALKKQRSIVFNEIRKKFGFFGILPFFVKVFLEQKRLKKEYPKAYQEFNIAFFNAMNKEGTWKVRE